MGLKKVATTTAGAGVGAGVGTVTLGPVFASVGAVVGGPLAPVTGPIGYGLGVFTTCIIGGVTGKKVGDVMDD